MMEMTVNYYHLRAMYDDLSIISSELAPYKTCNSVPLKSDIENFYNEYILPKEKAYLSISFTLYGTTDMDIALYKLWDKIESILRVIDINKEELYDFISYIDECIDLYNFLEKLLYEICDEKEYNHQERVEAVYTQLQILYESYRKTTSYRPFDDVDPMNIIIGVASHVYNQFVEEDEQDNGDY